MTIDRRHWKVLWGSILCLFLLCLTSCGRQEATEITTRPQPTNFTTEATTESSEMTPIIVQTEPASSEERYVDPSVAGKYVCIARYWQDEALAADDSWYELRADGTGTEFVIFEWDFVWSLEGNVLLMTGETGVETRALLEGDTLTVEEPLTGIKSIYSRKLPDPSDWDEIHISQNTEIVELPKNSYWNRGWYGWWFVESGTGAYSDWGKGNYWWDCCADIYVDGNGRGYLCLWDEDGSRQEPLAEVEFRLGVNEGRYGVAYSTDGYFANDKLDDGEWCIDPENALYEELLIVEGRYSDPNSKTNSFTYTIYLRPWGKLWDDWYADEKDCLPNSYETWYLPKLKDGVTSLPDKIA